MRATIITTAELKIYQERERAVLNDIYEREREARDFRRQREDFIRRLREFTNLCVRRGVVVIKKHNDLETECSYVISQTLKGYLTDVFKEVSRPLVILTQEEGRRKKRHGGFSSYREYWKLVIPKVARLKNLASGLLMVAEQDVIDGENIPIVELEQHSASWVFIFSMRAESQEIMNHWLEQVDEDPIFRACLDTGYYPKR